MRQRGITATTIMRKISFILVLFVVSFVNAQIHTANMYYNQEKEEEQNLEYDSTLNYLGNTNVERYLGQELYVVPRTNAIIDISKKHGTALGYRWFKDMKFKAKNKSREWQDNVYGHCVDRGTTAYEDLVGKVFIVENIEPMINAYCFTLRDKSDDKTRCKFLYNPNMQMTTETQDTYPIISDNFPFIVMAHYDYIKNKFKGRQCYIMNYWLKTSESEQLSANGYELWTIEDVILDVNSISPFIIVFQNNSQRAFLWKTLVDTWEQDGIMPIVDIDEWTKIIESSGIHVAECILNGNVCKGMTLDEVRRSLGTERKINTSSYGPTQFVFKKCYVYFENGVVVNWSCH